MSASLKANALFFTIIISLVIALLCSSLIFIAYYHRVQIQNNQLRERIIRNANSAIQLMLASSSASDTVRTLDLFGNGKDSIRIRQTPWGLFEVGHVTAFSHGDTISRSFMLGSVPDSVWRAALYMVDQGEPLSVSGSTLIKGTAYLPEKGTNKRNPVDMKYYERDKPIYGEEKKSTSQLPKLKELFLKNLLKQVDYRYEGVSLPENVLQADSLVVSFHQPTVRIHSKGKPLELNRVNLKGNIILSSDTMIIVSSNAKLDNIILTAPQIQFKDNFKGKVQAFATDTLLTGEDCHFLYPSSFAMLKTDTVDTRALMMLSKKCTFEGVILQYITFFEDNITLTKLHPEAIVKGQIYADGLFSMQGILFGTLVVQKLILNLPSGNYKDALLDCTIDRTALSPHFLGSPLFGNKRKGILQWIE